MHVWVLNFFFFLKLNLFRFFLTVSLRVLDLNSLVLYMGFQIASIGGVFLCETMGNLGNKPN